MSQVINFAKRALVNECHKVVHGHVNEIYAAILGYKSKAALGRPIDEAFREVEVLIADMPLAVERAQDLMDVPVEKAEIVVNVLLTVLSSDSIPNELTCKVYTSLDDYFSANYAVLEDYLINTEYVSSEMALTNAWGFGCDDFSFDELKTGDTQIKFVAYISGEQDPEKGYHGTRVTAEGTIEVGKFRNIQDDLSEIAVYAYLNDLRDYGI